jgi:hypothetical protein
MVAKTSLFYVLSDNKIRLRKKRTIRNHFNLKFSYVVIPNFPPVYTVCCGSTRLLQRTPTNMPF